MRVQHSDEPLIVRLCCAPACFCVSCSRLEVDPSVGRSMLRKLDDRVATALRGGTIRLVSVDFLLRQADSWAPPRMQELARVPGALVPMEAAAQTLERGDRSVFVLSYGWLTRAEPDPYGHRVGALRRFFQRLASSRLLPEDAALFWDWCSLPQRPRDAAEDALMKAALGIMADLYASPLGTAVVQIKEIPRRPASLDGSVLILSQGIELDEGHLSDVLATFGRIRSVEVLSPIEARAKFERHEDAERCAAMADGRVGAVMMEYSGRPYDERGWCILEESVACEGPLRAQRHAGTRHALSRAPRAKLYELGVAGTAVEKAPRPQNAASVARRLEAGAFSNGKADVDAVRLMYEEYQVRLASGAHEIEADRAATRRALLMRRRADRWRTWKRVVSAWRCVAEAIGAKGAARAAAREEAQALASAENAEAQAEAQLVGGRGSSPFSAEREVRRDNAPPRAPPRANHTGRRGDVLSLHLEVYRGRGGKYRRQYSVLSTVQRSTLYSLCTAVAK